MSHNRGLVKSLNIAPFIGGCISAYGSGVIKVPDFGAIRDGWLAPLSLIGTVNITLNGLSIEYKWLPNGMGRSKDVSAGHVEVKFIGYCSVPEGNLIAGAIPFPELRGHGSRTYTKRVTLVRPVAIRVKLSACPSEERNLESRFGR